MPPSRMLISNSPASLKTSRAPLGKGHSLSCTWCLGFGVTSCTGPSKTCPADNVCMSSYTVTTGGGMEIIRVFARDCETKSHCNMSGSTSIPNSMTKMVTSCCTTDNCTPPMPTLPADNGVMNGLTCSTCFSANSDYCYTSDTMQCTGSENMCLLQSTKITGSMAKTMASRGCATESICNIGTHSSSYNGTNMEMIIKCSNGSIGLYQGFFFPAVVALLLMKLLS
ncbi:hypothetical protein FKM82_024307 [Ascaphus truei]